MTIIGHAEAWDIGNYANPKYYFRYDSPRFQELFQESESTLDDKKRRELYAQMQKMLADEAPVVWLYMLPAAGGGQEGRAGHLEGPADARHGPVGGGLGEVAARAAVGLSATVRPEARLGAAPSRGTAGPACAA